MIIKFTQLSYNLSNHHGENRVTSFINRFLGKKNNDQKQTTGEENATGDHNLLVDKADENLVEKSIEDPPEKPHIDVPQLIVGIAQSMGMQRDSNEDALLTLTTNLITNQNNLQFGLYIIADGMGGYENGEIASRIAVEKLTAHVVTGFFQPLFSPKDTKSDLSIQEIMQSGVLQAHEVIKKETNGAGSTLTAALILGDQMTIAHVGDSRAYMVFPSGEMQLLTKDHSLVKRLEEIGQISPEQASTHPHRNVLYRALGQGEPFEPDISSYHLQPGSQLILCTDGLWGVLTDNDLLDGFRTSQEPQQVCQSLVNRANSSGGPDNISVIIVRIPE
jgi:protein phosphatase